MFIVNNPRTVLVHHLSEERKALQARLTKLKILKRSVDVSSNSSWWSVENNLYRMDVIELLFVQSRIDEIDNQIKEYIKL